jgi:hypothetical protein
MRRIQLLYIFQVLIVGVFLVLTLGYTVNAVIGENNVTVQTTLEVGNVYPEVLNVSCEDGSVDFSLTPANTTVISCVSIVRDFNGDYDIDGTNGTYLGVFFDTVASSYGGTDDNNNHYTNNSCYIDTSFPDWNGITDDAYTVLANCTFEIEYYANPENWNFSILVNDSLGWSAMGSDEISVNELLALGLPDTINYGLVNATYVSDENVTNVTNYGNVPINLTLEGYAVTQGDGKAMNCTLGSVGYINVSYEGYSLNNSYPGVLDLSEFQSNYTNLTSSAVTRRFDLDYRQNDVINEAVNETYWRIYVPIGVAGTCSGNIIFGATQGAGS